MTPLFERAKIVHTLERTATVIGRNLKVAGSRPDEVNYFFQFS
jgi:hypothetical protein